MLSVAQNVTEIDRIAQLTRRQQRAISAVLGSKSVEEGLRKAKVSRQTWYSLWLKDPNFKAAYDQARGELIEAAIHALRTHLSTAIDTLADLLHKEDNSPATRLRAAEMIIETLMKADRDSELVRRIEELERRAPKGARNNNP